MNQTPYSTGLTPAACLKRLVEPALDIDEDDNPLDNVRQVELRRSVLTIAELDHVSEITLVRAVLAATRQGDGAR